MWTPHRRSSQNNPQFRRRARKTLSRCLLGGTLTATLLTSIILASSGPSLVADGSITLGTLYASSGQFSGASLAELDGLRAWARIENAQGGLFVGRLDRRFHVNILAYDDHSSVSRASTLYRKLLADKKVRILVSDFGTVLTAPAVAVAREHRILLFDQTGTASEFFDGSNPYIVLCDLTASQVWPIPLAHFLISRHLTRTAVIYDLNGFDATQDQTIVSTLTKAGNAPIANVSVPTRVQSYTATIDTLKALRPNAIVELGYQLNDQAFLAAMQHSTMRPSVVFTANPGQLGNELLAADGPGALNNTYTYALPPTVVYHHVNAGMNEGQFESIFESNGHKSINFLNLAGYNTGVIIQSALKRATSTSELGIREALNTESGRLHTLLGTWRINSVGAQVAILPPVAQIGGSTKTHFSAHVVYPRALPPA